MTSWFRRAGQELARIIKSAADPAAEAGRVVGFAKDVGGVAQFFARSPDFARQVSGTGCNIFDKPLTAHALDDEFDSTVLNPAWTVSGIAPGTLNPYGNPGGVYALHTQRRPSWLMIQQAPGTLARITKDISSVSGGDFFVWCRASFNFRAVPAPVNNDADVALELSSNPWDINNRIVMSINESDAGTTSVQFDRIVGGVSTVLSNTYNLYSASMFLQPVEAIGMQKIGANYHGWCFNRGGSAIYMGVLAYAPAVTTASLRIENASVASPGTMISGYDFIRFKDGATYLP